MPGSRKLSKVGGGRGGMGGVGGGPPPDQGRSRFKGFLFFNEGGGGGFEDFQNERKNVLERHIAR